MTPLRKDQIKIGKPLPWSVYDREQHLLLCAGYVIESQQQLDTLIGNGLFRDEHGTAAPGARPAEDGRRGHGDAANDAAHDHRVVRRLMFEQLGLAVGAQLQMQRIGAEDTRYPTHLVGYMRDVSLLIRAPVLDGKLVLVREGQPVHLRAFSGTEIFSFTSSVLSIRFVPEPYLHLQYPAFVEGTAVRRQKRSDVKLIATTHKSGIDGKVASAPALVVDLAPGGARLRVHAALGSPGEGIDLAFRLDTAEGDVTLSLHAEIRSTEPDPEGKAFFHGIQFVDIEPINALALQGYVARVAQKEPKPR